MPRTAGPDDAPLPVDATLSVPEIRDYEQINKELTRLLAGGARRVVLAGVEGQRLLASGIRGPWSASIEVRGRAGPELAAGLDAPGVFVICRGDAADGAGSRLASGTVVVEGGVGDGLGYAQSGGTILVLGPAEHRAGLLQAGGTLVVLGGLGRLANEGQSGGTFVMGEGHAGPHLGRGRRGGRRVEIGLGGWVAPDDRATIEALCRSCGNWLPAGAFDLT